MSQARAARRAKRLERPHDRRPNPGLTPCPALRLALPLAKSLSLPSSPDPFVLARFLPLPPDRLPPDAAARPPGATTASVRCRRRRCPHPTRRSRPGSSATAAPARAPSPTPSTRPRRPPRLGTRSPSATPASWRSPSGAYTTSPGSTSPSGSSPTAPGSSAASASAVRGLQSCMRSCGGRRTRRGYRPSTCRVCNFASVNLGLEFKLVQLVQGGKYIYFTRVYTVYLCFKLELGKKEWGEGVQENKCLGHCLPR